jgi:uncharacterized protein YutE (UPF0331/DUF86 family)
MNDVAVNKIQSLQRCVRRARQEYAADPAGFRTNDTRQDAAMLNVLRACETAIDLANLVIRDRKLGIPTASADAFRLLATEGILAASLADRMVKMVGFRNTVVHQYQQVNIDIVIAVIVSDLNDVLAFAEVVRAQLDASASR